MHVHLFSSKCICSSKSGTLAMTSDAPKVGRRPSEHNDNLSGTFRAMNLERACSILGLPATALLHEEDINKAYRILSFKYHPDKNLDDTGCVLMQQELNAAREFLRGARLPRQEPAASKRPGRRGPRTQQERRAANEREYYACWGGRKEDAPHDWDYVCHTYFHKGCCSRRECRYYHIQPPRSD